MTGDLALIVDVADQRGQFGARLRAFDVSPMPVRASFYDLIEILDLDFRDTCLHLADRAGTPGVRPEMCLFLDHQSP